jgi:hypothetical protein
MFFYDLLKKLMPAYNLLGYCMLFYVYPVCLKSRQYPMLKPQEKSGNYETPSVSEKPGGACTEKNQ